MHYSIKVPGAQGSGLKISVSSPFDPQKVIGTLDTIDEVGAEKALSNASDLFNDRANWLSASKRIEILEKTAVLMLEQAEQLADIALQEGGKPLVDSQVEVARAIDGIKNCADCIKGESGKEIPMQLNPGSANRLAFTTSEPIGVVVAVSAFNHPLNLIVHQIGPAIASGCPVIIKPAEDTPLSCFFLVDILRQAGLPDGWCQPVVAKDLTVAQKLVTDDRVAFFSFIGSAKVGWFLRSQLAPGTRCALEHGGAAPVILAQDADLENAIPSIVKGGFYHAGQVCVSVQRVFVHQSIVEEFVVEFCNQTQALVVGDPAKKETEVGPLIRAREVDRVEMWINEAVEAGAVLVTGGKRLSEVLYQPTILLNPPKDAKVSQLEIFGPVVCLYSYDDIDDAITQANSLPVAFQAAVYSRDIDTAMYAFKHLNASAVMINDHTAFRVDWMPFAGLKQSGHGVGGISYTYEEMQIKKMAVIKSASL
jgi:acyl-CoA reductase-like NAD-dependent aldehyde dehydrogenase